MQAAEVLGKTGLLTDRYHLGVHGPWGRCRDGGSGAAQGEGCSQERFHQGFSNRRARRLMQSYTL